MVQRVVFDAYWKGRWVMVRRHRSVVSRLNWLLLAGPVGVGAVVGSWRLVGAEARQATRVAYAVVMFGLVAGSVGLVRKGRR